MEPVSVKHIVDFYRYNSKVRKKYLDAMERLPWSEIVTDRGASFNSIRNVFLHVLDAYRYWFQSVVKGLAGADVDPESCRSLADMRAHEREVDEMVMNLVESLREEDLRKVYVIHSAEPDDEEAEQISMETLLMHMIEEELQHRGEINCMFWQQDVDPPITGYGRHTEASEAHKN